MTGKLHDGYPLSFSFDASEAVCAQTDPELFFPTIGDNWAVNKAKEICVTCPLVADCLAEAVVRKYDDGIWGASSPRERRLMRKNTVTPLKLQIKQHISKQHAYFAEVERKKEARRKREQDRRTGRKMEREMEHTAS